MFFSKKTSMLDPKSKDLFNNLNSLNLNHNETISFTHDNLNVILFFVKTQKLNHYHLSITENKKPILQIYLDNNEIIFSNSDKFTSITMHKYLWSISDPSTHLKSEDSIKWLNTINNVEFLYNFEKARNLKEFEKSQKLESTRKRIKF